MDAPIFSKDENSLDDKMVNVDKADCSEDMDCESSRSPLIYKVRDSDMVPETCECNRVCAYIYACANAWQHFNHAECHVFFGIHAHVHEFRHVSSIGTRTEAQAHI